MIKLHQKVRLVGQINNGWTRAIVYTSHCNSGVLQEKQNTYADKGLKQAV